MIKKVSFTDISLFWRSNIIFLVDYSKKENNPKPEFIFVSHFLVPISDSK